MANSFLDLIGLAHFKAKLEKSLSDEYAKKAEVVTKEEASAFARLKTCSEIRDRAPSKPDYGLSKQRRGLNNGSERTRHRLYDDG